MSENFLPDEWDRAYAAGLEAARAAIDRVASDMANWSSAETAAATDATPDLSVDQWMWAQRGVHRALAAIDALSANTDKPAVLENSDDAQ